MSEDRFQKEVDRIFNLQFFGIKLGLVNIKALLEDLGRPQDSFKVILVAGTNGKGSCASTLAAILQEAGHTCGLFTSPHLVRFNERFAVNGQQIADREILDISDRLWKLVDDRQQEQDPEGPSPITFFEFATAMACLHFKNKGCDIAVFECGLGGRLDATNALDPVLDVFMPISLDHTQYLGETLTQIATEKSGICRQCVPAVVAEQTDEAKLALFTQFQKLEVPSLVFGRDYGIQWEGDKAYFYDPKGRLGPVKTALPGAYQFGNTAAAMAAARVLQDRGVEISDEAILAGPLKVYWPGRLEKMAFNPVVILDGAHNQAAAALLAKTLTEEKYEGPTVGVMSIMGDKDVRSIVRAFAPGFDIIVVTKAKMPRALALDKLAEFVSEYVDRVDQADELATALEKARQLAGSKGRVVICGSLFLVGEARALLLGEKGQGKDGAWVGVRG